MRVTVCQIPAHDDDARREGYDALFAHAREERSDLVVIPEMAMAPWLANSQSANQPDWDSAVKAHDAFIESWGELPFAVIGSRPVNIGEQRLNQGFVHENGLTRAVHHKRFLPNEPGYWEAIWYHPGDGGFDVFDVAGCTAGLMICTDLWFIEHGRALGRGGADIICHPRATERKTAEKWRTGVKASAVISGAYVLSSNLWEPVEGETEANLGGGGMIGTPDGELIGETDAHNPFLTRDLNLDYARKAKSFYPRYVM